MFEPERAHIDLSSGVDTDGAAEYLHDEYGFNFKSSYLVKLRSVGGGPAFYRVGRTIRYLPWDLDQYANSRISGPLATSREGARAA